MDVLLGRVLAAASSRRLWGVRLRSWAVEELCGDGSVHSSSRVKRVNVGILGLSSTGYAVEYLSSVSYLRSPAACFGRLGLGLKAAVPVDL